MYIFFLCSYQTVSPYSGVAQCCQTECVNDNCNVVNDCRCSRFYTCAPQETRFAFPAKKKKSDSCGRRVFCLTETWLAIPSAVAMHFIPGIYTCFVSSLLRLYRFLVRTAIAFEASNFLIFLPCETAWCSFFRWILNCSNSLVVSVEEPV